MSDQTLTTTPKVIASSENATLFSCICVVVGATFRWHNNGFKPFMSLPKTIQDK